MEEREEDKAYVIDAIAQGAGTDRKMQNRSTSQQKRKTNEQKSQKNKRRKRGESDEGMICEKKTAKSHI
jgi:hypothetical protein